MKKNMSGTDRVIRAIISLGIFLLILMNVISGTLAIILGIVAGIFLLTTIFGICPIYAIFRFSTNKKS